MLVAAEAEGDRRVALRVEVDGKRLAAELGDAGAEVDGGRGLPHPALLVGDRVDESHRPGDSRGSGPARPGPGERTPPNSELLRGRNIRKDGELQKREGVRVCADVRPSLP